MFAPVDTRVPSEVEGHVRSIYRRLFPKGDPEFVARAFGWASTCFSGGHPGYQAIDAGYHDFEHTLQGTLCLARLLHGRHAAGARPAMTQPMFELALLSILFHDSGYLKQRGDNEGTGAKYTLTHVARGAAFAREFLGRHSYGDEALASITHMILCTGVNADLAAIPVQNELERVLGFAVATADLLGQMAALDYVDKLPVLHLELVEAARQDTSQAAHFGRYPRAEDLMRGTEDFWNGYVLPKLKDDFRKLYLFLNDPHPDGPNQYLQRIQENLDRLRQQLTQPVPGAVRNGL